MSFVHYRIVLKLLSPLHIGKRKYRNLMETREYVPGRTLWGALTARITRDYFGGDPDYYKKIGDFLIQNFRFGYLWPALKKLEDEKDQNETFEIYFPWGIGDTNKEEKGKDQTPDHVRLIFKYISHDDFDNLFKFGYMGQPIDYTQNATFEGGLHEVEYIGPKTRNGDDVYLIGDIWIKDGVIVGNDTSPSIQINSEKRTIEIKNLINSLQLGGEKGYGWGRVGFGKFKKAGDSAIGNIGVKDNGEDVILVFKKGDRLISHLIAENTNNSSTGEHNSGLIVEGEIEPLTGYQFLGSTNWIIPEPPICFVPGSRANAEFKAKVLGDKYGILQIIKV